MSNSIWNKYDIKDIPDENKLVVLVDKDDGFYNARFVDKIDWANDWYDHIEKWCYLDDLIAQADKAERLQKAVDNYEKVIVGAMFAPDVGDVTAGILEDSHKTIKQLIKENQ